MRSIYDVMDGDPLIEETLTVPNTTALVRVWGYFEPDIWYPGLPSPVWRVAFEVVGDLRLTRYLQSRMAEELVCAASLWRIGDLIVASNLYSVS